MRSMALVHDFTVRSSCTGSQLPLACDGYFLITPHGRTSLAVYCLDDRTCKVCKTNLVNWCLVPVRRHVSKECYISLTSPLKKTSLFLCSQSFWKATTNPWQLWQQVTGHHDSCAAALMITSSSGTLRKRLVLQKRVKHLWQFKAWKQWCWSAQRRGDWTWCCSLFQENNREVWLLEPRSGDPSTVLSAQMTSWWRFALRNKWSYWTRRWVVFAGLSTTNAFAFVPSKGVAHAMSVRVVCHLAICFLVVNVSDTAFL